MTRYEARENNTLCEEWEDEDCNIVCLQESSIPGAFLNERKSRELNVSDGYRIKVIPLLETSQSL